MSYHFLLDLALILLTTKLFGMVTKRFQLPQVVGALIAGLVMGPAMLNIIHSTEFLSQLSELGVIVMMFTAGLGTNLDDLKQSGKPGLLVASFGVLTPLLGGTLLAFFFNDTTAPNHLLQDVFIGVVLTATSVSITVAVLKELGKLTTHVGNTILSAALIDDILGLVALTIVTSIGGAADISISIVLIKIVAFFIFLAVVAVLAQKFMAWYAARFKSADLQRYPIFAFVLCLVLAFSAEHFFGVADIIGAFAAGLIVSTTSKAKYIETKFSPLSYLLLTPIFFASVGLKVELPKMDAKILLFALLLIVVAILAKIIGCGFGAKICGMKPHQCLQVGVGMACRGEVALIVANKGIAMGLMPDIFFGPIILMVITCAIATPVMLKLAFRKSPAYDDLQESTLVDRMEEVEQLDYISENLIRANKHMMDKKNKKK